MKRKLLFLLLGVLALSSNSSLVAMEEEEAPGTGKNALGAPVEVAVGEKTEDNGLSPERARIRNMKLKFKEKNRAQGEENQKTIMKFMEKEDAYNQEKEGLIVKIKELESKYTKAWESRYHQGTEKGKETCEAGHAAILAAGYDEGKAACAKGHAEMCAYAVSIAEADFERKYLALLQQPQDNSGILLPPLLEEKRQYRRNIITTGIVTSSATAALCFGSIWLWNHRNN